MLQVTALVELVWQDETGSRGAQVFRVPSSSTVAEIDAQASALASISAPLTSCVLVGQRIRYTFVEDNPAMAASGSSITHCGVLYFSVDPPSPDSLISIPAIVDSVFSTTEPFAGYLIDITNADIVSFSDAVLAAGATNPFGDALTALVTGYLQSRV